METRMLKRPTEPVKKLTRSVTPEKEVKAEPVDTSVTTSSLDTMMSNCMSELMNARNSFHKLHLKVTGTGSYAAHKALNELYDQIPDFIDTLSEGYQGVTEKLMSFKNLTPRTVEDVSDAVNYLRELYAMINKLQSMMPYSEIVNNLDLVKDAINSTKYKLLFLK
jgi:DNA-binding ferritin-like protein